MSDAAHLAGSIAAWLPQARWFAGKGTDPGRVTIADMASIPLTEVSLSLVDVATAGGSDRYVVPLARAADAALDPGFAAWIIGAIEAGATLAGREGSFRGHRAAAGAHAPRATAARVSPLGGDASNTSLLVGHAGRAFAVKLLRRCRPGIQPEVEVGEFFTRHAPWEGTPRFVGWLEYASAAGETTAVATLHEFAAGCTSAWEHLVPLLIGGGLAGPGRDTILEIAGRLGRTTAEMHRALGSRADIAAFAPETATAADRRHEAERMVEHATRVFALAAVRRPTLPAGVCASVDVLLARRDAILAALGRLADVDSAAALIRIHSDYHLGQVLLRPRGLEPLVIDFEGEPGRSLADRRRKTTVLKDVAGMCRSFDYALRHAAQSGGPPYDATHRRLLETRFLDAYRAVARGHAWWPADGAAAAAVLAAYTLDKAVYELAYELTNRPDWVEVPLAALLESSTAAALTTPAPRARPS